MAPLSRVCYGSDTYGSPEPFFSSALLGRQMLSQVLEELIADGFLHDPEKHGIIIGLGMRRIAGNMGLDEIQEQDADPISVGLWLGQELVDRH